MSSSSSESESESSSTSSFSINGDKLILNFSLEDEVRAKHLQYKMQ